MAEEYSFSKGSLLINGVEITGYADGDDLISAVRNNDTHSHIVGGDGNMAIAQNADRSGSITFRLLQTSTSNAYLSGLIAAAESGLSLKVTAQYLGLDSVTVAVGTFGYILRPSDIIRGQGINTQEWVIQVENLTLFSGNI